MEIFALLNFIALAFVGYASLLQTNAAPVASIKVKETFTQLCIDEYTANLKYNQSLQAGGKVEKLFEKYKKLVKKRLLFGEKHNINSCPSGLYGDLIDQIRDKEKDSFKSKVSSLFGCFGGSDKSSTELHTNN